jgi:hypothetical protein
MPDAPTANARRAASALVNGPGTDRTSAPVARSRSASPRRSPATSTVLIARIVTTKRFDAAC